jgi:hypothetical protein
MGGVDGFSSLQPVKAIQVVTSRTVTNNLEVEIIDI